MKTPDSIDSIENVANQSIEEMNLVEIRSHDAPKTTDDLANATLMSAEESKKQQSGAATSEEVKGFALTVKETFIDNILAICENIRPLSFLNGGSCDQSSKEERPFSIASSLDQLLIIADEAALIKALDPK